MTKRIFRSITAATLAVLLVAVLLIMGALYSYFTEVQFAQLRAETALTAHAVTNEGLDYFEDLDSITNCRITWIACDGTVLYDTRSDSGSMENHMARQEVIDARDTGYGQSARYSYTLLEQYLYAAQRLPDGTILRLSTARVSVIQLFWGMAKSVLPVILAAVLLSLFLANRLAKHIVQPLNALDLSNPTPDAGYEEIRPLLLRLHSQQAQLRAKSREIEQKQLEFLTVTRSMSEGLVLLSSSGTILSINPAAARLLEITSDCRGKDWSRTNQDPRFSSLVEKALSGEKAEQNISLETGIYLAAASPVKTDGTISGVVLLLLDMTQKQQAETLRREFTANVSHELKTPLHAISGYAELLMNNLVLPEDIPRFSRKVYGETQRLIRLVEDILRLSRLEDGTEDLHRSQVDLFGIAQQVIGDLTSPAELAGIDLTLSGESAVMEGIPQLLSSIIFNLTDNAIKYNRSGGSVAVEVTDAPEKVILKVIDTGIGIPAEYHERVFERFYRVDKSHSKAVGGTGLGLSFVKHAAMIHHAKLDIRSTPNVGTAITISFPKKSL